MHIDPKECHPAMDYNEHQKTYKLFLKLTVYIIVGVVALGHEAQRVSGSARTRRRRPLDDVLHVGRFGVS